MSACGRSSDERPKIACQSDLVSSRNMARLPAVLARGERLVLRQSSDYKTLCLYINGPAIQVYKPLLPRATAAPGQFQTPSSPPSEQATGRRAFGRRIRSIESSDIDRLAPSYRHTSALRAASALSSENGGRWPPR